MDPGYDYMSWHTVISLIVAAAFSVTLPAGTVARQADEHPADVAANEVGRHAAQQQLFSLSIDDAEIRNVVESLAVQAGLSLVLPEDIAGRVTLRLRDVTWQTALDATLKAGGYAAIEKDGVLFIFNSSGTLTAEIFELTFANAGELEKTVNKLVSSQGKVGIDERLNSIVVTDTASNLEQIRRAIGKLDRKAPQVMIEALIVNVKLTDKLKMGVDWTQLGTTENFYSQGLSITGGANPFGELNFSTTSGRWSIQGLIDFVQTNDDVRILANPKVLVLNSHTAIIKTVTEIPYQELSETSAGGNIGTTSFKEAGVKLEVTPQITADGFVIMNIKPEQSAQISTFTIENSDVPVIETRNTETTLRVRDGQTIIIGGLRERQPSVKESKIPILGDIPLIGALFRKVSTEMVESELGVFITPHIYTDGKLSAEEQKLLHSNEKNQSPFEAGESLWLPECKRD
jgi:type II secretory pathway component GspD/PulD (secretin)